MKKKKLLIFSYTDSKVLIYDFSNKSWMKRKGELLLQSWFITFIINYNWRRRFFLQERIVLIFPIPIYIIRWINHERTVQILHDHFIPSHARLAATQITEIIYIHVIIFSTTRRFQWNHRRTLFVWCSNRRNICYKEWLVN
jgi:hypothetical protein